MSSWTPFGGKSFAARAQAQAMAFERMRAQPHPEITTRATVDEIIHAISDPRLAAIFTAAGRAFALKRETERLHKLIVGGTGSGKSTYVRLLLTARTMESALRVATARRSARSDLDGALLDIEAIAIDPKDDAGRIKMAFAAAYRMSPADAQRVLRGSFLAVEVRSDRVTPRPLLTRQRSVSVEFQAQLTTDILVLTSPADFSATVQALLFQLLRLLLHAYDDAPLDPIACHVLLTDAAYRHTLLHRCPADLANYFGRLQEHASPQTIAALLRRLQMLLSHTEIRAMLGSPGGTSVGGKTRRITIADCGTTLLPPSVGLALANLLVTEVGLVAGTRDRSIEKTVFLDESTYVLSQLPSLLARFLNVLRVLRSSNTSFWFAAQSLQSLPAFAIEEILTNVGQVVAFQSRDDIAAILAPHEYVAPGDTRREHERRSAFMRDLTSLPPREAVLWVKGYDAFRTRIADVADPVKASGISERELLDIFDSELAAGSTITLEAADRLLAEWRVANLPASPIRTAAAATQRSGEKPSMRSIFGLEEDA
jgi:hypothetical protein